MFKWNHLHSLGIGSLLTFAFLSDHLLWTLTLTFFFGVLFGRSWDTIRRYLSRPRYGNLRLLSGDNKEQ